MTFTSFLPEASFGLRVLSLPASIRQSIRHQVCPRDDSSLGSPNLDQRCKTPRLRSLLFRGGGAIDLDLHNTKFGPEVQKYIGKDPYCFGGQLTLTFKVKFDLKSQIF